MSSIRPGRLPGPRQVPPGIFGTWRFSVVALVGRTLRPPDRIADWMSRQVEITPTALRFSGDLFWDKPCRKAGYELLELGETGKGSAFYYGIIEERETYSFLEITCGNELYDRLEILDDRRFGTLVDGWYLFLEKINTKTLHVGATAVQARPCDVSSPCRKGLICLAWGFAAGNPTQTCAIPCGDIVAGKPPIGCPTGQECLERAEEGDRVCGTAVSLKE